MSLENCLKETLTTHEYNDVTGAITVNVTDALMAIANAINRLATVQERAQAASDRATERLSEALDGQRTILVPREGGGHA
jgi:hypothetical protein